MARKRKLIKRSQRRPRGNVPASKIPRGRTAVSKMLIRQLRYGELTACQASQHGVDFVAGERQDELTCMPLVLQALAGRCLQPRKPFQSRAWLLCKGTGFQPVRGRDANRELRRGGAGFRDSESDLVTETCPHDIRATDDHSSSARNGRLQYRTCKSCGSMRRLGAGAQRTGASH